MGSEKEKKKPPYSRPYAKIDMFGSGREWDVLTTSAYVNYDDDQFWDDRDIIDDPFA